MCQGVKHVILLAEVSLVQSPVQYRMEIKWDVVYVMASKRLGSNMKSQNGIGIINFTTIEMIDCD